jgi:undecaprenyl-diphosphatase
MDLLYFLEDLRTPLLDTVMLLITELGGETVFLAAAIVLFWCVDKKEGYYMMTVGFAGIIVNQFLKLWFRIPRPWVKDPNFTIVESARAAATGYSFPSGHTQNVFAALGAPARYTQRKWLRALLVLGVCLTAVSRMYLGVHTPLDVGVSFILGTVLVLALYPLFDRMKDRPAPLYALYAVFILGAALFVAFVRFYHFPADLDMTNYEEGLKNGWMMLFCSLGLLIVFHLDRTKLQWPTKAPLSAQIVKVAVGLGLTLALKSALKAPLLALFHSSLIAHGVRYGVVILFAGILWPMTFRWFAGWGKEKSE